MKPFLKIALTGALTAALLACKSKEPAPAAEPPKAAPTMDADELRTLAQEAEAQAVKIRGIAPEQPVRTEVTSKDDVERYLVARIEDTDARAQLSDTARMLVAFGVMEPGTDLEGVLKGFIREQVAGYYDWEKKTLYVADWIPTFLQRPTLVHEVTHALQDQRFDLGRFMEPIPGCTEPQAAIQALIEGDATLVMAEAMLPEGMQDGEATRLQATMMESMLSQMTNMPGLEDVPPVLRETFFFPYTAGLRLVSDVRSDGGWRAVDALFAAPPVSTEQVLHTEKLLGPVRDDPRNVALELRGLPGGLAPQGTDIVGELGLALILEQSMPRAEARKAAAGWDGDRFVLLSAPGRADVMLFASVWDTPEDAEEAEAALRRARRAPARLERRETLVVGVWGEVPEEQAATIVTKAIEGMSLEEVATLAKWHEVSKKLVRGSVGGGGEP